MNRHWNPFEDGQDDSAGAKRLGAFHGAYYAGLLEAGVGPEVAIYLTEKLIALIMSMPKKEES